MFENTPENQQPHTTEPPVESGTPKPDTLEPESAPAPENAASDPVEPAAPTGLDALHTTPEFDPTKPQLDQAEIDRLTADMFKRAGLSPIQKWSIFFGVSAIIALFLGGGIALYILLDPFSDYAPATPTGNDGIVTGDTDGDGLIDIDEARLGTDVAVSDTDGDGLDDGDEVNVYTTDPLNSDTDGDGYVDGDEVINGYDPNGPGRLENE